MTLVDQERVLDRASPLWGGMGVAGSPGWMSVLFPPPSPWLPCFVGLPAHVPCLWPLHHTLLSQHAWLLVVMPLPG